MKIRFAVLLVLSFLPISLMADFSGSQLTTHPRFPGTDPFIIELKGTWPSDCHPGEQKPVLEAYDGLSVEIGLKQSLNTSPATKPTRLTGSSST